MKVAIYTFPFVLADALRRMVDSAVSQRHDVTFYLSIHSVQRDVLSACLDIASAHRTAIFNYGFNRGLARSANDAILAAYQAGADVVINCNDDVTWGAGDVDRLVECAADNPGVGVIYGYGTNGNASAKGSLDWCVAAINPIALDVVGCFDENFHPAYFEDCDYTRRMRLAGLPDMACQQMDCHHMGSASIYSDDALRKANDATFVNNRTYWHTKWGKDVTYTTPFNAGLSLRIAPHMRHTPYGQYDRTDL